MEAYEYLFFRVSSDDCCFYQLPAPQDSVVNEHSAVPMISKGLPEARIISKVSVKGFTSAPIASVTAVEARGRYTPYS